MTPSYDGYFADPFVVRLPAGDYAAYGTGEPGGPSGRVVEALYSPDLVTWESKGRVLDRSVPGIADGGATEWWAPEVLFDGDVAWMYYSVGRGIHGHHLRVAAADSPWGPFEDTGVNLTPGERFAIDAHPFVDDDGRLYLFFARDVLTSPRPGTHLAVMPMRSPTESAGDPVAVLAAYADWQIYERDRPMYGRRYDWHTLEGPSVVKRRQRYWMTFSAGAWTGPGYQVSWASAPHPLGPWTPAGDANPPLLSSTPGGYVGPGHNSLTVGPDGTDVIAFHAWDAGRTRRQMHLRTIVFADGGPVVV